MKSMSFTKTLLNIASLIAFAAVLNFGPAISAARAEGPQTELGQKMKIIGKSMKQLKSQIGDASKQQSTLDLLETAKKSADEAKKLTPSKATDVPEADRAKFITDYQDEMDKLIGELTKIEDAVRAGKYDDATKLYSQLGSLKREGHQKFQADKD